MVDCGEDWRGRLARIAPDAVVVTHAHPDHAWGLQDGANCPVFATEAAWEAMADYPVEARRTVAPRQPVTLHDMAFEAFPVLHSLRAPAVGYRITAGEVAIFYVPDVSDVEGRAAALDGVALFVGDGATLTRPMVRRHDDKLFGHTTVRAQLGWCREAGVGRAVFTHCGSEIVEGDERSLGAKVRAMGRERGVEALIAHDGMEIVLR